MKITIIGSGVSGLSSAIALSRRFPAADGHRVRILTDRGYRHSTSIYAAAVWYPYDVISEDEADVTRWGMATFNEFIARYVMHPERTGVRLATGIELFRNGEALQRRPPWADSVAALDGGQFEQLSYRDLVEHHDVPDNRTEPYAGGSVFTTILIETPAYLAHLVHEFQELTAASGNAITTNVGIANHMLQRTARGDFADELLAGEDIIVNCTGVGARFLCGDRDVRASLGRVIYAPLEPLRPALYDDRVGRWRCLLDGDLEGEELIYLIPRPLAGVCVLGGTAIPLPWQDESGDWSRPPAEGVAAIDNGILERCDRLLPGVKQIAESRRPLLTGAGLRPARPSGVALGPRRPDPDERPLLINNYGHGGAGVTLSWGCAAQVVHIVEEWLSAGARPGDS